ncbi:MAG: SAM-dependent methyltransferase [Balneolaceae bacterium]|nr:MAG: SAM-dependent methyltransferase [Balneolaceae bacterium]
MKKEHTLYLIPTPLGKEKENHTLPEYTLSTARRLSTFIVEKPQTAVSFLKWINHPLPDFKITFRVLNKKTPDHEVLSLLRLLEEGDVGLMSEAGLPAVADPGSGFISLVHEQGYQVVPLTGPSSIFLALMASGLNGQQFSFHGYLSLNEKERISELRFMEDFSLRSGHTQIFIETPHRSSMLASLLIELLSPATRLCIATNLTLPGEQITSMRISEWRETGLPDLQKQPSIFLFSAG